MGLIEDDSGTMVVLVYWKEGTSFGTTVYIYISQHVPSRLSLPSSGVFAHCKQRYFWPTMLEAFLKKRFMMKLALWWKGHQRSPGESHACQRHVHVQDFREMRQRMGMTWVKKLNLITITQITQRRKNTITPQTWLLDPEEQRSRSPEHREHASSPERQCCSA